MILLLPLELGNLSPAHISVSPHVTFAGPKRDRAWGRASWSASGEGWVG